MTSQNNTEQQRSTNKNEQHRTTTMNKQAQRTANTYTETHKCDSTHTDQLFEQGPCHLHGQLLQHRLHIVRHPWLPSLGRAYVFLDLVCTVAAAVASTCHISGGECMHTTCLLN